MYAFPFFIFFVNAKEPTSYSLVNKCLSLHNTLSSAFSKTSLETENAHIEGTSNVSFHYQNVENSFKGICSNAQFSIEENELKGTKDNQQYVFIWSTVLNAEPTALSIEKVEYSVKQPENISSWLREKI